MPSFEGKIVIKIAWEWKTFQQKSAKRMSYQQGRLSLSTDGPNGSSAIFGGSGYF